MVQKSIENFCTGKSEEETNDGGKEEVGQGRAKRAKTLKETNENKPKDVKPINRTDTDYSSINFNCERKSVNGQAWNFKISSWNVVSLKAVTNKNGMEFLKKESPDVMCFQETKCGEKKVPEEAKVPGYHRYFASGKIFFFSYERLVPSLIQSSVENEYFFSGSIFLEADNIKHKRVNITSKAILKH